MGIFSNIFAKKQHQPRRTTAALNANPALPYSAQPRAVRRHFAASLATSLRNVQALALTNSGYKVVSGRDQENRPLALAETGNEFKQLSQSDRNRIISFARKLVRNSDQMEAVLHQFEIQVVGTVGGKAVFDFGASCLEDPTENAMTDAFAAWASRCEFFDDYSLNRLLKLALRTQILGGDLVLVFDDDLVENSGQIIVFEPDCIGNIPDADFKRLFPRYTQTQGIIKNANAKTIGAIVSWSQRGQNEYSLKTPDGRLAAWPLIKPAAQHWKDSLFILHRHSWRFNQGHGSSGIWAALATLCDLTDLQGYEIQSAKKNAQTIAQVTQTDEAKDAEIDKDLNPDAFAPIADGSDTSTPLAASPDDEEVDADFEVLNAAGCVYELMPKGVKAELLDTKHPNANMPQFITWLQRVAAYSIGLSAFHATGKADSSYSAAMAEIQLSQKTFDDAWHDLEAGILDWLLERWFQWARRNGTLPVSESDLPPHWQRKCVSWQRPQQKALNPVDEQRAFSEGLRNGTMTYRDIYGADWKRSLAARAKEKAAHSAQSLRYFPETDNNGMAAEGNDNNQNSNKETPDNES